MTEAEHFDIPSPDTDHSYSGEELQTRFARVRGQLQGLTKYYSIFCPTKNVLGGAIIALSREIPGKCSSSTEQHEAFSIVQNGCAD